MSRWRDASVAFFRFAGCNHFDFLLYNIFCLKNDRKTYNISVEKPIFAPNNKKMFKSKPKKECFIINS